ncbi:MIOREX complex component 10 [Ceratocystis fimbriata CBS 114723]|uniref:MIOREX complex component 10 n=1 Tax=Ceratocystis fimbriata CBS 114723 TaxID=1035309 RepID=A0A2C5X4T6_9PEZI|nr:MIOREX complex component 10 [Ceratocystis fimbriata CBS 114723]
MFSTFTACSRRLRIPLYFPPSHQARLFSRTIAHGQNVPIPPSAPITSKSPKASAVKRNVLPAVGAKLAALRRAGVPSTNNSPKDGRPASKLITAICMSESFTMPTALRLLKAKENYAIDPHATGLSPNEVIHAQTAEGGDVFVFRSGTIVTWGVDLKPLTAELLKASIGTHPISEREVEDLDFVEDSARENSRLKGDLITLGTKPPSAPEGVADASTAAQNITLAKVAFSSALARSTRLAVLENKMGKYGESTNDFTNLPLDSPSRLRSSQRMILQLSKDLLILRARLNHHSELTDPIPDLFWDSRAELGLERYFEQVSEALDISVRIEILNQRLDYAQEIIGTIRTMGTEQESTRLEWIIILLITVEVIFETRRIVSEIREESRQKIERLAISQGIPIDPVTRMPVRPVEPAEEKAK